MLDEMEIVDGILMYDGTFLPQVFAQALYQKLLQETPWRQDYIRMYGREVAIPRLQAWYGDPGCYYRYSGIELTPLNWTAELVRIKQEVERVSQQSFNSVLINYYRNGRDGNGWHSDDEPELGEQPVIASLSLGAVRRFRLRHKKNNREPPVSLDLASGSLVLMAGSTQKYWQHCLTKTSKSVSGRINLTFREIQS